ncbi:hypothetical protein HYC85_032068 [Camellia sinensis]|uniref:Uncharacterized protein n=1 Tax=Camellia sinensis TaxID=4442 RepID=A0A7J7FSA6_CAMSI|nr:hypothetical protein HYC85_032068 [Camellia sinensis]
MTTTLPTLQMSHTLHHILAHAYHAAQRITLTHPNMFKLFLYKSTKIHPYITLHINEKKKKKNSCIQIILCQPMTVCMALWPTTYSFISTTYIILHVLTTTSIHASNILSSTPNT